jgi:hypothetical protein
MKAAAGRRWVSSLDGRRVVGQAPVRVTRVTGKAAKRVEELVYEGDRSRRHLMISFLLSLILLLDLWNIL